MTIKRIEPNPNNIHVAIGEINRLANANGVYRDEIKTLKKKCAELERVVQLAIDSCCLDEKDESVLAYALNKGGDL